MLEAWRPARLEPDLGNVRLQFFFNRYGEFSDTNNLSLVTFLHYRDVHVVFPGDLERRGWEALLRKAWGVLVGIGEGQLFRGGSSRSRERLL